MTSPPESDLRFVARAIPSLLGILVWAAPLGAHGLKLECESSGGDRIAIRVSYEDGGIADRAAVRVLEADADRNDPITEGKADEKGVFSCPRPESSTFRVEAEHAGHATAVLVTVDPGGAVSVETLAGDDHDHDHDHDHDRVIRTILFLLLIVIGARLVVRLVRGRRPGTAAPADAGPGASGADGGSASAPDATEEASPKGE